MGRSVKTKPSVASFTGSGTLWVASHDSHEPVLLQWLLAKRGGASRGSKTSTSSPEETEMRSMLSHLKRGSSTARPVSSQVTCVCA